MDEGLVIFLHDSRYGRLYQAVNLLATASSMGRHCHLFLFWEALAGFLDGSWDTMEASAEEPPGSSSDDSYEGKRLANLQRVQHGFELANIPSLYELLDAAVRDKGGVSVYACSASVRLLALDPAEVRKKVDEIIGLPTMLRIVSQAKHVLYI
jgi:peroxiredoxin family protein